MIHRIISHNLWHRFSFIEEDFAYFRKQGNKVAGAVADGITRDLITGESCRRGSLAEKILSAFLYQRPSHARIGAEKVCRTFVNPEHYSYYFPDKFDEEEGLRRMELGNLRMKEYNDRFCQNLNYLENDLAGCVASSFLIRGRDLFHFFIADCGVAVYNKKGDLVFETDDEGPGTKGGIDEDVKKRYGVGFNDRKGRKIIRKEYRNNPSNPLSYGTLTGEDAAMDYVRTGYRELKEGEVVVLFTDGLRKMLRAETFREVLMRSVKEDDFSRLKKFCKNKVEIEGTALIYVSEY